MTMMWTLVAALAVALMMTSAHAQSVGGIGAMGGGMGKHQQHGKAAKSSTPQPKVDEKAYNAALKSIPDKPFDSWSGMR